MRKRSEINLMDGLYKISRFTNEFLRQLYNLLSVIRIMSFSKNI